MRLATLTTLFFAVILGSCATDDKCHRTRLVCLERETRDNLVMEGDWAGTYDVGRHLLGTNDVTLSWFGDSYEMRVRREKDYRDGFFDNTPFKGYGALASGQTHFKARFSLEEQWHFNGRYYNDDEQVVFKGSIGTNGNTIGTFRMARNRKCLHTVELIENICQESYDTRNLAPKITFLDISPADATGGTQVRISAKAEPKAEWKWNVNLAPATAPTLSLASWSVQAQEFGAFANAPTRPGEYMVTVRVEGNGQGDLGVKTFIVRP